MLRAILVSLVAWFALVACAPEDDHPLIGTVSTALPAACVANILEADAFWAGKLGKERVFTFHETDSLPARPGYREVTFKPFESRNLAGHASATYDRAGRVYLGAVQLRGECSVKTVAHEMGHILGLGHRHEPGAVMNNSPEGMEVTSKELARALVGSEEP